MNIKEITQKTGLTKKSIYYYIEEGLINPKHNPTNNYLMFENDDLETLNTIVTLRKLDISIEDIKDLFNYPSIVNFILHKQHTKLRLNILKQFEQMITIENFFQNNSPSFDLYELNNSDLALVKDDRMSTYLENCDYRMVMIWLWSSFMNTENTEYREFLWKKLCEYGKKQSNINIEEIASYLYNYPIDRLLDLTIKKAHRSIPLFKIEADENLISYCELCKQEAEKLIQNPGHYNKTYESLIKPLYTLFTSKQANIMEEYNDNFVNYKKNCIRIEALLNQDIDLQEKIKRLNTNLIQPLDNALLIFYTLECDLYKMDY